MRNYAVRTCAASLLLLILHECVADDVVLGRVVTRKAESYVGEIIPSPENVVAIFDIGRGSEIRIPQSEVLRLTKPISMEDAARSVGLPALAAWQISRLPAPESRSGKIAQVTPTAIYLTLKKGEVEPDQRLAVYRRKGEIKNPDTGEILAVERPRIAELKVTEISDNYSKAVLIGQLEVELAIGDEVELPSTGERKIAVCPLYFENGQLSDVGARLSEDLTTLLVQKDVSVVERSELASVLGELLLQKTILFDPKNAQKLGQLTGASHVAVGKIVPSGKSGKAYMRLVDVATGEIRYAASATISLVNARIISSIGSTTETPSGNSDGGLFPTGGNRELLGRSRVLPSFLTATGQYRRTEEGAVIVPDANAPIRTKEGTFLTKNFTFEVTVEMTQPKTTAYIGIGTGLPRNGRSMPKDSVNLRFSSSDLYQGTVTLYNDFAKQYDIGKVEHPGTHLVRIIKEGNSLTFLVDPDNDGPSDDDFETTIADIRKLAPYMNSKNTHIFFSGATFREVNLSIQK